MEPMDLLIAGPFIGVAVKQQKHGRWKRSPHHVRNTTVTLFLIYASQTQFREPEV